MFDLEWIRHILWGLDNITSPNKIDFLTYQEKRMMENVLTNFENSVIISGAEKEYIWNVARYFGIKIYENTKLIKERKGDISVFLS